MRLRSGTHTIPDAVQTDAGSLERFMAIAAEAVDAHTAAVFLANPNRDQLRMAAFQSVSDRLISDATFPVPQSIPGGVFDRGVPVHEAYFAGDPSGLGMYYSGQQPIMAYMAAPVGTKGLLWLDTRKVYRFTERHLKILLELARTAEDILGLTERASGLTRRGDRLDLIQGLLPPNWQAMDPEGEFFDKVVRLLVKKGEFDGALLATILPERGLCQVKACDGFSPILTKGRFVRIRQGWVKWSLEHDSSVIISGLRGDERTLTIFHTGETMGFETKSLAVIPWCGPDDFNRGVLVLASKKTSPRLEEGKPTWQFLGSLAGLVRTVAHSDKLMHSVRKYDGESGLANEGYFRHLTRLALSRERERKGNLLLLLVSIVNMDELYLCHDHSRIRLFLETFTDKLLLLTRRKCVTGKFSTGGFGLFVENVPSDEIRAITKKAESIMGTGTSVIDGEHIYYEVESASAHYPDDCTDFHGLWTKALERLTRRNGLT